MKDQVHVPENILDAITAMLSPTNPELTKEDIRKLFEGSGTTALYIEETVYTRQETAERFKVSLPTINRWLADGTLKKVKIGGSVRITESEIQRHLQKAA